MKVKLYIADYKGKFDILSDNPKDDWYGDNEPFELDTKNFDWKNHCALAMYYGVPPYIGRREEIHKIIKEYEDELEGAEFS